MFPSHVHIIILDLANSNKLAWWLLMCFSIFSCKENLHIDFDLALISYGRGQYANRSHQSITASSIDNIFCRQNKYCYWPAPSSGLDQRIAHIFHNFSHFVACSGFRLMLDNFLIDGSLSSWNYIPACARWSEWTAVQTETPACCTGKLYLLSNCCDHLTVVYT